MLPQMMPLPWVFLMLVALFSFFTVYLYISYFSTFHLGLKVFSKTQLSSISW